MATSIFVRGSNPVWSFVDLSGKQFDDTFYMYVLENTIPYIPAIVYNDPSASIEWTNPIQFLANGTLPIDIYWDPTMVYRLEFRQNLGILPPSQNDPLIYLVTNYSPLGTSETPEVSTGTVSDNQITNPQFALTSFSSPFSFTGTNPPPIEVAPGWFLTLTGTGTVALSIQSFNSLVLPNPTNAPYALRITLSGAWTNPVLSQTFSQNGVQWSGKFLSSSVTAAIANSGMNQIINAQLVDSLGNILISLLPSGTIVTPVLQEFQGFNQVPTSVNTQVPPVAFVQYQLLLPNVVDIFVTSFQLIVSDTAGNFDYEEDTIERQIDHTWHYYYNSVLLQPKNSVLTGWNFSLNPFQFQTTAITAISSQCQYVADQTIMYQKSGAGTVASGQSPVGSRHCFEAKAINTQANNQFALIQYIDPSSIAAYWGYIMSALARSRIFTSHGTQIGIKLRLIYSSTLPNVLSATEPVLSWSGVDPVFSAQWTAIAPENDPVYILPNAFIDSNSAIAAVPFNNMQLPAMTAATQTLGIVIYTTANMNSSLGTEDSIVFDRISLAPNTFAIDTQPETFNKVLADCQYYYEKSYDNGVLPMTASTIPSSVQNIQNSIFSGGAVSLQVTLLEITFNTVKRIFSGPDQLKLYSPQSGAINNIFGQTFAGGTGPLGGPADISLSNYNVANIGTKYASYSGASTTSFATSPGGQTNLNVFAVALFHFTMDARLGLF